jgi:methionyl-tRNA synthetase
MLREWVAGGSLQPQVLAKLNEWFETGLQDWDISRDAPYFGFEIPDAPGKFFYVWFDAPIGYIGSFLALRARTGVSFADYWESESATELHHFIGKDISYFHTLFWPAVLHGGRLRRPTAVHVHGFLTVNGQKMSKSRGTFITARSFLNHVDPEYLRYYFAAKLNERIEDLDLNFEDFTARVNSDLVGKYVNIASRTAGFINTQSGGALAVLLSGDDRALLDRLQGAAADIERAYEARRYGEAVRQVMELADQANAYINELQPWRLARDAAQHARAQQVCTTAINAFRLLTLYLKPVLPRMAAAAEEFLAIPPLAWR